MGSFSCKSVDPPLPSFIVSPRNPNYNNNDHNNNNQKDSKIIETETFKQEDNPLNPEEQQNLPQQILNQTCGYCGSEINEEKKIQLKCILGYCYYHQKCFNKHLKNIAQKSEAYLLKCKCGTQFSTLQLRNCTLSNKMNLLARLFENQLDILIKNSQSLRNNAEIKSFIELNRISRDLSDYYLLPTEDLEYEETPQ